MRKPALLAALLLAGPAAAPAQTPAGPELRVNEYTPRQQQAPRVSVEPDGDFVVVWTTDGQDGNGYAVYGRRFGANGAPRGSEFRVNTYTTYHQAAGDVAVGPRGDFVVSWTSAQDGSADSVVLRRFDPAGQAIGAEVAVNSYTTGNQYGSRIGRAADGCFVVAWLSQGVDGQGTGVAARRFDPWANPLGDEFVVNTQTAGNQGPADIAVAPDGTFVVVWADLRYGADSAIVGQRFDALGARVGGEFVVNSYTPGVRDWPSISVSPAGGFVVAWTGLDGFGSKGMFARRLDAAGNGIGADFAVNTFTTHNQYGFDQQVAHDAQGNFVVTWESWDSDGSESGARAQRFDASGARRGVEFAANTYTTGRQRGSVVAADDVGNFTIAWWSPGQDGDAGGVFAQRFGGLRPTALAVVDGGNGILEVPDDFALRTTWRNVSGAPRTFQGQGSEFTGPPGLVYTLGSATADYGTVADGGAGTCSGACLSGALLGVRPAGHVDVGIRERILPDTLGQDQRWILHVGRSFDDVPPASPFYRSVETLLHRGVTAGCTGAAYCPTSGTTREQMAVFVLVGKEGAGYAPPACGATPVFADVPSASPFCRWIEELARRGVVAGCGGGNFCPQAEVSREQMAVFVLRTLDPVLSPPACGAPMFADVPASSVFCRWIEELARRGVVSGCGGGNYCPVDPVTREQMGVFLSGTFGLTLYGP